MQYVYIHTEYIIDLPYELVMVQYNLKDSFIKDPQNFETAIYVYT